MTAERLTMIHALMSRARSAHLHFVPAVYRHARGTWLEHEGGLWELTDWLRGSADYHASPSPTRLAAACVALAQVHETWIQGDSELGSCPGLARRWERLREWTSLVLAGWQPLFPPDELPELAYWVKRAMRVLALRVEQLPQLLASWVHFKGPIQPCLCDIWHDHVLFSEDRVSGIIDYGGVRRDHPAVDLARLLGSFVGDDDEGWQRGLAAYRTVRRLSEKEGELARVLDRSGTVLGLATWLKWLYHDRQTFADRAAVARRLAELVQRVENWK